MAFEIEKTIQTWKRRRSDDKLFRELADAHGLDARSTRLLLALADRYRLVRSSEIFVRPSLFTVSPDRKVWSRQEVQTLRGRLFGSPTSRSASPEVSAETTGDPTEPGDATPPAPTETPSPSTETRATALASSTPSRAVGVTREAIEDPVGDGIVPVSQE